MKLFAFTLPLLLLAGYALASPAPGGYLVHRNSGLMDSGNGTQQDDPDYQVLAAASEYIATAGGEQVLICRAMRIEAPLGGWLVDGLAELEIDGIDYSTFRVGIDDSGEVFTLIARCVSDDGVVCWFPVIGPDYRPGDDELFPEDLLEFEFLIGRDDFEVLEQEFPRPGPCS